MGGFKDFLRRGRVIIKMARCTLYVGQVRFGFIAGMSTDGARHGVFLVRLLHTRLFGLARQEALDNL
jgi:hypothetical protein